MHTAACLLAGAGLAVSGAIIQAVLANPLASPSIIGVNAGAGLAVSIFLAEVAPKRLADIVRPAIELLAGIPSVVYGLVGMSVLVPWVQSAFGLASGATLFTAILVLAVMILPYIINVFMHPLLYKSYHKIGFPLFYHKFQTAETSNLQPYPQPSQRRPR